jgi:hypothetical protein
MGRWINLHPRRFAGTEHLPGRHAWLPYRPESIIERGSHISSCARVESDHISDTGYKPHRSLTIHQIDISPPTKRALQTLILNIRTSSCTSVEPAAVPTGLTQQSARHVSAQPPETWPTAHAAADLQILAICSRGSDANDPSKAQVSLSSTWWLSRMRQQSPMSCIGFLRGRRSRIRPKRIFKYGLGRWHGNLVALL